METFIRGSSARDILNLEDLKGQIRTLLPTPTTRRTIIDYVLEKPAPAAHVHHQKGHRILIGFDEAALEENDKGIKEEAHEETNPYSWLWVVLACPIGIGVLVNQKGAIKRGTSPGPSQVTIVQAKLDEAGKKTEGAAG